MGRMLAVCAMSSFEHGGLSASGCVSGARIVCVVPMIFW